MRVARVNLHADVASFRHPFFVTGRQPTSDLPPPSTLHGLCACALGAWPEPESFVCGLHFTWRARATDLEHQHLATALPPRTTLHVATPEGEARATTEISVQPVLRDFLFDCALTLYLPVAVGRAFRAPVYPLVLGRSQDLAEVVRVDEVDLLRSERARLEHTLLPRHVRPAVRFGATVLLSRLIGPPPERAVEFAQYVALREPVYCGDGADETRAVLRVPDVKWDDLWVDPEHVDEDGWPRGVYLLRLTG